MVNDTIKAITKNNIKLINTTSLSDSKSYLVKWQHISTISFPMFNTIQQISIKTSEQDNFIYIVIIYLQTFIKLLYSLIHINNVFFSYLKY